MPKTKNPTEIDLPAVHAQHGHTLRIDLAVGFRTKREGTSIGIASLWRADLYDCGPKEWVTGPSGRARFTAPKPVWLGTVVSNDDESPADLLATLSKIYAQGKLPIKGTRDDS